MRYVGSKRRIARGIRDVIISLRGDRDVYWEPFAGGCNSFSVIAPEFRKAYASDAHEDLMLMWQAALSGWVPPVSVTPGEYESLRTSEPSALRGFVGFGGSFGGKWFGGYAKGGKNADGTPRNYPAESSRAVIASIAEMTRTGTEIVFRHARYHEGHGTPRMVIYCDPPYASTLGYKGTDDFDHAAFWLWAEDQTRTGALVVVSEYSAPDGWQCVAEFDHRVSVASSERRKQTVERIFIHKLFLDAMASHMGECGP